MQKLAGFIAKFIDYFYRKPFTCLPHQVFVYAACGGANMLFDWLLYFVVYNFVVGHELLYFSFLSREICISPHIAALCIVFPITLLSGFWLNKYVTFHYSTLAGGKQLFRYILIVAVNLSVNYFGLKICVEHLLWYPTPSKIFITLITVLISFFGQKYFTFSS
jgi:putative flippase GtrA